MQCVKLIQGGKDRKTPRIFHAERWDDVYLNGKWGSLGTYFAASALEAALCALSDTSISFDDEHGGVESGREIVLCGEWSGRFHK